MTDPAASRTLDQTHREFLSHVGHVLRTPLTSIRSFAEILLRYDVEDPERRQRFLGIIHTEAERLAGAIDELLGQPDARPEVPRTPSLVHLTES